MNITNIKIYRNENTESKVRAFATFTIDDSFAVTGVAIVEGMKGLFISMPSRKDEKSESGYRDICFPVTKEARKEIEGAILKEYKSGDDGEFSAEEASDMPF